MTTRYLKYPVLKCLAFAGLSLAIASCKPELEAPASTAGEADFTRYVAFGNSLTAGVMDGGLYLEGQQNSYPAIIAQQMKQVGGGEFEQPLFPADKANGTGYLFLNGFSSLGLPIILPITAKPGFNPATIGIRGRGMDGKTDLYSQYATTTPGQFTPQNLGIPFLRLGQVLTFGFGANNPLKFNPFFERLSPGTMTYTSYAMRSKPTFFTCWLGSNDVLGFASAGGDVDGDQNSDYTDMTVPDEFERIYKVFLDSIRFANPNAKGLLSNISNVTNIPYFTTFKVSQIVAAAKQQNPNVDGLYITTAPGVARKATDRDLILLDKQAVIGRVDTLVIPGLPQPVPVPHGFSLLNPLRNNEVLDSTEVAAVTQRTTELNARIESVATLYNLAHWDAGGFLDKVRAGLTIEGVTINSGLISGNGFSLDGTHLTPMGYAIAANEMIKSINAKYKSRIPTVSVTRYRGVRFP